MGDEQVSFVKYLRSDASTINGLMARLTDLPKTYYDRQYNTGGAYEITDADAQSAGLHNAAEVTDFITLLEQLKNFFGNSAVTQGDYQSTINKLRGDV